MLKSGITNREIVRVKKLLSYGVPHKAIEKETGVHKCTVSQISSGNRYSRITEEVVQYIEDFKIKYAHMEHLDWSMGRNERKAEFIDSAVKYCLKQKEKVSSFTNERRVPSSLTNNRRKRKSDRRGVDRRQDNEITFY